MTILIVDRKTKEVRKEIVYGESLLQFVYKQTMISKCMRALISKMPLASYLFGIWQRTSFSKKQIAPFVKKFQVNLGECVKQDFPTFNDFFIRKLQKQARIISQDGAVAPVDGRYLAYDRIGLHQEIFVKGKKLSISKLLEAKEGGAKRYIGGSLLMARLAPADYHRFHFPVDAVVSKPRVIGGYLFSVNPVSLRTNIDYLSENKRVVVELQTKEFGLVSFIAVGATNVGSIHFTYQPGKTYRRGDEMGYFSFGASMCIALFEPGRLTFAKDITENTQNEMETLCSVGQSLITSL